MGVDGGDPDRPFVGVVRLGEGGQVAEGGSGERSCALGRPRAFHRAGRPGETQGTFRLNRGPVVADDDAQHRFVAHTR